MICIIECDDNLTWIFTFHVENLNIYIYICMLMRIKIKIKGGNIAFMNINIDRLSLDKQRGKVIFYTWKPL